MFPFGIFPFNMLPMLGNPWWPVDAAKTQQSDFQNSLPPLMKTYMEVYAAWTEMVVRANPWTATYKQMLDKNK